MSTTEPSVEHSTRADNALFRPVRQGNAFEETVERIVSVIKLGVVPVGGRLPPERELALRLGVSRVTLREAIRALAEARLVESRRGRYGGTFVRAAPASRRRTDPRRLAREIGAGLDDSLAMRRVVESGAAELAAERAAARELAPHERRQLEHALHQTAQAEPRHYRRCDSRLHLAVAELTGSASVVAAVADARMRVNTLLDAIPLLRPNIVHSDQQHAAVVAAVLTGRATKARRAMTEHLDGTAALLHAFLS